LRVIEVAIKIQRVGGRKRPTETSGDRLKHMETESEKEKNKVLK
jgi:hypothetical protein